MRAKPGYFPINVEQSWEIIEAARESGRLSPGEYRILKEPFENLTGADMAEALEIMADLGILGRTAEN